LTPTVALWVQLRIGRQSAGVSKITNVTLKQVHRALSDSIITDPSGWNWKADLHWIQTLQ